MGFTSRFTFLSLRLFALGKNPPPSSEGGEKSAPHNSLLPAELGLFFAKAPIEKPSPNRRRLFLYAESQEKPRTRRGEDYDSFCLVTINAFTRSQSCSNSEFTLSASKSFPCKSLNMLLGYTQSHVVTPFIYV